MVTTMGFPVSHSGVAVGIKRKKTLISIHPGEILQEEWMIPLGLSQYALAKAIGVSPRRINEIVHGKRAISADTALRLGLYFGVSPQSWLNLQTHYDLEMALQALGGRLHQEVHPRVAEPAISV
jgi:addiction module HigA family antidote